MTFTATTRTNYEKFLKELYRGAVPADLCYDSNALLALVPKNPNTGGTKYIKPVSFSYVTGRSATYTTANANVGAAQRKRWEMDWTNHYVKAGVDHKALELSEGAGDAGAFRSLLVDEVDNAHKAFANDVEIELHQDGTGRRGTASGVYASGAIPLNEGMGVNFNVGDVIVKYDLSGATLEAQTKVITAVDRENDKVYIASDFTVATAAGDYLLLEGDSTKAYGLKSWLPGPDGIVAGGGTAPNTLNAIDRSADPVRLAGNKGVKGTASGLLITDSLVQTCAKINKNGGRPNLILISPEDYADLCLETEDRARYAKVSATEGSISFSALEVATAVGAVPVVGDRHTESDQGFVLDTRVVELYSTNTVPSIWKRDGSFYNRVDSADEISFYLYAFYGLALPEPGRCAWIQDMY
jgi:hypothetical protein